MKLAAGSRCCACVITGKCVRCACVKSNRPCTNCYPSKEGTYENIPVVVNSSGTCFGVRTSTGSVHNTCSEPELSEELEGIHESGNENMGLVSDSCVSLPTAEKVESCGLGLGMLDGESFLDMSWKIYEEVCHWNVNS